MQLHEATIVSIQVGKPQIYGSTDAANQADRPWQTAFFKQPVSEPVRVRRLNLAGDGQADRSVHGGLDKAVLAYAAAHYVRWQYELDLPEMSGGGFGENLTIAGLTEEEVCIGDAWQAGEVVFQVSQPRQPCWKLARRWGLTDLPKRVVATGRSGWYLRVLEEGTLTAGVDFVLQERPHPSWTIAAANRLFYAKQKQVEAVKDLASLPELSKAWREGLIQ